MTLQQVREAAKKHTAMRRRNKYIFWVLFAAFVIVSFGVNDNSFGLWMLLRIALGALWIMYLPRYREQPPSLSLGPSPVPPGLQFYRAELAIERDYFRSSGKWAPAILYVTLVFVTTLYLGSTGGLPMFIAFLVFLVFFYFQRKRALPAIEREIRMLDSLSK